MNGRHGGSATCPALILAAKNKHKTNNKFLFFGTSYLNLLIVAILFKINYVYSLCYLCELVCPMSVAEIIAGLLYVCT